MLGLLVKDFRLLSNQKQFFAIIVLISIFLVLSGQEVSYAVVYCTMMAIFFTISTVNYDEYNNGYAFMFTMPITRRQYAIEKYLFASVTGGSTWLLTTIVGYFYGNMRDGLVASEWFAESALALMALGAVMCVMLPIQLKFGAEKGRIAVFAAVIIVTAAAMMIERGMGKIHISSQWLDLLFNMNMTGKVLLGGIVFVLFVAVSIFTSIHIVEKKQF